MTPDPVVGGAVAALLGARFSGYAWRRLRGYALAALCGNAAHVLEVWLFFSVFVAGLGAQSVVAKLACDLLTAAHFGALERMRATLRADRGRHGAVLDRWFSASVIGAGAALCVLVVRGRALGWFFAPSGAFELVAYARLAMSLLARTFHSGAYAYSRVYRPIALIPLLEITALGLALLLSAQLGPSGVALAMGAATALGHAVAAFFTLRQYRERALPTPRFRWQSLAWPRAPLSLAAAALAGMSLRFGELAAVTAVMRGSTRADPLELRLFFYLLVPPLSAATAWPQSFYHDLVHSASLRFAVVRARLTRSLRRAGVAIALAVFAVAWLPLYGLGFLSGTDWIVFLPLLLALPQLAIAQMDSFTRGALWHCAARVAIVFAAGSLGAWLGEHVVGHIFASGLCAIAGGAALAAFVPLPSFASRSDWAGLLATLRRLREPCTVFELRVSLPKKALERLARELTAERRVIAAALDDKRTLFVALRAGDAAQILIVASARSGGAVHAHRVHRFLDGRDAARALVAPPAVDAPEGLVIDLAADENPAFAALPRADQELIVRAAFGRAPRGVIWRTRTVEREGILVSLVARRARAG
jgi:hypothetical protein